MKRKAIKEVMDAVERGQAFTVYGIDGEPLAMVLPWADWQALNKMLVEVEERLVPPSQRVLSDPNERVDIAIVTPEEYIEMHRSEENK